MPLTTLPTGTKEVKAKTPDTQLVDAKLPEHQSKESETPNNPIIDKRVTAEVRPEVSAPKDLTSVGQQPVAGSNQAINKPMVGGDKKLENAQVTEKAPTQTGGKLTIDELSVSSLPHSVEQRTRTETKRTETKEERSFFTSLPEEKLSRNESGSVSQQSIFIRESATTSHSVGEKEPTRTVFRSDKQPEREETKIPLNPPHEKLPQPKATHNISQESIKEALTPSHSRTPEREEKQAAYAPSQGIQKEKAASSSSAQVVVEPKKTQTQGDVRHEIKREPLIEKKPEVTHKGNISLQRREAPSQSKPREGIVPPTHRYPSAKVTIERRVILPVIPAIQRSIDWVTRVLAGEKIASPSPAIAPLTRLKEVAHEAKAVPLKTLLRDAFPKIQERLASAPKKEKEGVTQSPKEKFSAATQHYKHLKEIIKSIEGKVIQSIQRELQPHIKELVKAEASPIDSQKLKQLIVLKDLFQSSCEKAKLVVEQSLSVIKTLQTEVKNIPQEVFESFKSLLQEIVRAALPLSTDPESLDPEQIARLMSKIRGLLSQLRDQAMASGDELSSLEDLLDLLEEMELLEQIEIELLEELLALEEARDVETLLEQEEALAEIEAIIRRDAYKKLLEQKEENEVAEVFSLIVRVVDDNDLPQAGVFVYGGQLGVLSTNSDGEVRFENIEQDTFVIIGLDPELGICEPDSYSLVMTQHEVVQFKLFESSLKTDK